MRKSSDPAKEDILYKGILKYLGEKKSTSQPELIPNQTIELDLTAYENLKHLFQNRDELLEGLARSPEWYVFKNNQGVFAFRRFAKNETYFTTLNGYFTSDEFVDYSDQSPYFQFRLVLGFQDGTWSFASNDAQEVKLGEKALIRLDHGNQSYESHIIIKGTDFHIEFFEQNPQKTRHLTIEALSYLNDLAERRAWQESSPSKESADLVLTNGFQGGLYELQYWVNPGEPGFTYLKAFEITKNTPLSAERMERVTQERAGWSDDPSETFYGNSHFTIYEGNWNEFYGARIELWFRPLNGGPERLLMKKNYRVQGWMR